MATWVTPLASSQSRKASRSAVVVPKVRTCCSRAPFALGTRTQAAAASVAEPEALVEAHQMGRGIDMHAAADGFEHCSHEGDGRALAVGACDMDDRGEPILRVAEIGEQPPDAVEREIDRLWIEGVETIEYVLRSVAVQD